MLNLSTEEQLKALVDDVVKESLHIEYKASDAVDKRDDRKKKEIARDVSAFANADGGQIIYGMKENKDQEPDGLDAGLDPREYPESWFEQILQQHVMPPLKARPYHVPLSSGRVAVVIDIQASSGEPHQTDGRYYRRHNFNRLPMEHYEVKQMFYRTTTPDLFAELSLSRGDNTEIAYNFQEEYTQPISIGVVLANKSAQPAFYSVLQIGVHTSLALLPADPWNQTGIEGEGIAARRWLTRSISSPPSLPIFKEVDQRLSSIMFRLQARVLGGANRFPVTVKIMSPGFLSEVEWTLHQEGQHLRIQRPGHLLSR
ncbi:ATP-binding protein [Bradyrhizobium sp. CIAT3101]|uniref:AlbA family DNA-binding domain-containing protein n=1 Tax=Bradyrhizobium sp. CIAT3101 TaxID=439387 RepID=UPI0024B05BD8|nr:ATP-binding protein [Bradyrhizobium sp. CIAT3101]WFU77402.1 ATP-binding protein [Bradyrhizobium sp. CIAT3101]